VKRFLKIVSGGQTGADRGGIAAAFKLGTPYGGFVPKGRRAEDGEVPACFTELVELLVRGYPPRTRENVRLGDATVIFGRMPLSGGCKLTLRFCREEGRPVRVLDPDLVAIGHTGGMLDVIELLIERHDVRTLNVAGHRESVCLGLELGVERLITKLLERRL